MFRMSEVLLYPPPSHLHRRVPEAKIALDFLGPHLRGRGGRGALTPKPHNFNTAQTLRTPPPSHLDRRVPEADIALDFLGPHLRRGGGRGAVGSEVDECLGGVGLLERDGGACEEYKV